MRREIQDNNGDWEQRRKAEELLVGVDDVQFNQIFGEIAPGVLKNTRNEDQGRRGIRSFHPGFKEEGDNLAGNFWRWAPNREVVKTGLRKPWATPINIFPRL